MEQFTEMIIGHITLAEFMGYLFWVIVGTLIYQLMEVKDRNKHSDRTPYQFNLKFWFLDNWKRLLVTFLLILVNIRFWENLTGSELTEYTAFLVGFGSDGVAGFLKKRTGKVKIHRQKL